MTTTQTADQVTAAIRAEMAALDNLPLPGILVLGQPVTRAELNAAFNLVVDKKNWKYPINTAVDLDDKSLAMVREAVQFFAGCVPTFTPMLGATLPKCRYHVKAVGYYVAVGA